MNSKESISNNQNTTGNTGWEDMGYRKVDVKQYVDEGLANGSLEVFEAAKSANIQAKKGEIGQEVISWSEDKAGRPIQEKVAPVASDPDTGEIDWVVTKIDTDGNPVIDDNGHMNQWIVTDTELHQKYNADPEHPGIFNPADNNPQKFVETSESLTISQWGDEMRMPEGSFINITNPDDMYAINPRDFNDTYSRIEQGPQE